MFLNNVIFHFYLGGRSVTVMSGHRSCPLVPAMGMSGSAGHCVLTNVKLPGLEAQGVQGVDILIVFQW